MRKLKSHHFCSAISFFVGLSFLFERYLLISPAILGPVAILMWVPIPISPLHLWGVFFLVGAILIEVSPNPLMRAIFLICGMASWSVFAGASLYGSLLGDHASTSGSLIGIVLVGLVLRFYVAIRDVVVDFTSQKKRASIDA